MLGPWTASRGHNNREQQSEIHPRLHSPEEVGASMVATTGSHEETSRSRQRDRDLQSEMATLQVASLSTSAQCSALSKEENSSTSGTCSAPSEEITNYYGTSGMCSAPLSKEVGESTSRTDSAPVLEAAQSGALPTCLSGVEGEKETLQGGNGTPGLRRHRMILRAKKTGSPNGSGTHAKRRRKATPGSVAGFVL